MICVNSTKCLEVKDFVKCKLKCKKMFNPHMNVTDIREKVFDPIIQYGNYVKL